MKKTDLKWDELQKKVSKIGRKKDMLPRPFNMFSSTAYRSIQFTARELVRVQNPLVQKMERIDDLKSRIDLDEFLVHHNLSKDLSMYVDFEVQILDRKAFEATLRGPASHEAYKERQRQVAIQRLFSHEGEAIDELPVVELDSMVEYASEEHVE